MKLLTSAVVAAHILLLSPLSAFAQSNFFSRENACIDFFSLVPKKNIWTANPVIPTDLNPSLTVASIIQLQLAGVDVAEQKLLDEPSNPGISLVLRETTGIDFDLRRLVAYGSAGFSMKWDYFLHQADVRLHATPFHMLIALDRFRRLKDTPKVASGWEREASISLPNLEKIQRALDRFKILLNSDEQLVFAEITSYYSSANVWNPAKLEAYVSLRLGTEKIPLINEVFAKMLENNEVNSLRIRLVPDVADNILYYVLWH